jgi:hypothetical protein
VVVVGSYLPKGVDISELVQTKLDAIARQLFRRLV